MNGDRVKRGVSVFGPDGERLGRVLLAGDEAFVLERGRFAPECYLARYDQLREERGELMLVAPLDALPRWEPDGPDDFYPREDSFYAEEPPEADERRLYQAETPRRDIDTAAPHAPREELRLPLVAEELVAEKRFREVGRVRIHKTVKTEHRAIVVPVRREEIRIERVSVGAPPPREAEGEVEVFVVPVFEEEIEIRKRPVLKEEIRVIKTVRREERELSGEVRREDVEVDGLAAYGSEVDGDPRA
jgi:uncharacterized protein (TIGR02271 family)